MTRLSPGAVFGSLFLLATPCAAHMISSNFDCAWYGGDITGPHAARENLSAEEKAARVASKLPVVPGRNGQTIFPRGTDIDRTAIQDGYLYVWITFPSDVREGTLDRGLTYQGGEILRHYFAESEQLAGIRFRARSAGQTEYKSLEAFIRDEDSDPKVRAMLRAGEDWFEPDGPGPQPDPDYEAWYEKLRQEAARAERNIPGQSAIAGSGMPTGALAGRIIFTYGGHGRTWDGTLNTWRFQRGPVNGMLEDFGNADASDAYAYYCFNAGATVVSFRPIGYQDNEVIVDNTSPGFSRTGSWSNSVSTRYYGSGSPPYYYASTSNSETATATYTPNIPVAGYYPVYTWVNYGSDRVPGGQLYRIRSTGGESLVRVDHRRVGCGWVYLGTYYFNAGSNPATGSVVISNLNPPSVPAGSYVVIADAIRFGNGMGNVNNGGGISGYSRREESTVYWIQNGWGNGDSATANVIWNNSNSADDENLSWSAPPRMAAYMYRVHSDTTAADKRYALYLGWHSNAAGSDTARGSVGLITGSPTTNQNWWATKVSDEIDALSQVEDDNWEYTWFNRSASTYEGSYGEITNSYLASEMDATIIEVAFHTSPQDAALMRDPKVRNAHGKAAYRAAVQYFNHFRGGPLAYLPEPPTRFRVVNSGPGSVTLSWQPGPTGSYKGQAATSYRVYRSPDGLGFDGGTPVTGTQHTITGLTPGTTYYFRVTGVNAGGESFPTDTLAVRVRELPGPAKVLIVSAYDRLDRFNDIPHPKFAQRVDQIILERNNSYNYVRQHAAAIAAHGLSFDSADNESVISGDITLTDYQTVVWIAGEESSADNTFNATERSRVSAFLNAGGKSLFVSGAEIGYELVSRNVDPTFYTSYLAAGYGGDDGGSYQATGVAGTIFAGLTMNFPPSSTMYDADYPDRLNATGGSIVCATYTDGGSGGAAVQFSGGTPPRKVVNLGFPFETINSATTRNQVMAAALDFFGVVEVDFTSSEDWQLFE